jgi:hypothetical protein
LRIEASIKTRIGDATMAITEACGSSFASGGYSGSRYDAKTFATIGRIRFSFKRNKSTEKAPEDAAGVFVSSKSSRPQRVPSGLELQASEAGISSNLVWRRRRLAQKDS